MQFRDLENRHAGAVAYIIGTGPGLDAFDGRELNDPATFAIVIHRAIGVTPIHAGRTYWQVLDDAWQIGVPGLWTAWRDQVVAGNGVIALFKDPLNLAGEPQPESPNIVRFRSRDQKARSVLTLGRHALARDGHLHTYSGSGCTAIHAAWYMGASRAVLVGLDGADGYATCLAQWYDKPARGGFGYYMAREAAEETAEALNFQVGDYGP